MTRLPVAVMAMLILAATGVWLLTSQPTDPAPPAASSHTSPPSRAAADGPDRSPLAEQGPIPPAPRTDPPTPTFSAGHDHDVHADETPPPGEPWRATLTTFSAAFTDTTGGQQAWHRRLARLVSPPLAEQLAYTDPHRIPPGTPISVEIVSVGAYAAAALVTYDTGWSLHVQVVDPGTSEQWWVTGYQLVADERPADRESATSEPWPTAQVAPGPLSSTLPEAS